MHTTGWVRGGFALVCAAMFFVAAHGSAHAQQGKNLKKTVAREPVPEEVTNLGAYWFGHELIDLASIALDLPPKGEFESSDQFAARYSLQLAKPVYRGHSLRLTDRIAVVGPLMREAQAFAGAPFYRYDADAEVFQVCVPLSNFVYSSDIRVLGTYKAKNAFGRQVTVQRRKVNELSVSWISPNWNLQCFVPVGVPRDVAKEKLQHPWWALVGRLREPYASVSHWKGEPKIDHPYEDEGLLVEMDLVVEQAIVYQLSTGEVFYQRGWNGP